MSFQSTIERPDSVKRVTPPRTTAPATIPEQPASHKPILRLFAVVTFVFNATVVFFRCKILVTFSVIYATCGDDS
ncbi:hypothetical protein BpHYR1_053825 [Brachionus plicatilis]|uniref:Uncharacterized protein n=1 Tax=Brachionus plicatilis TaxID=10195 RepID=A0A3M7R4J8_BRAPC|nr:hypothetical protein BpHYR1_053825 [Brachionus plicatilis]